MPEIPLFKVHVNKNADKLVGETLRSGMLTQSTKVEEFENKLKEFFNHPWVLTLNAATSGLTLAYRLLDAKQGSDQVISTPLTCFATNAPILANRLDIVWADTDPTTCNIDLEDVKQKITEHTTILSIVHWGGNPVDLDKVEELKVYTKEKFGHELRVVEDCAHAFGGWYKKKRLGTHGNIAVFSLQAIKHLTTGDGGLILLPNKEMYERAKLLRWYGIDREKRSLPGKDFRLENDIPEYGYKFHMNDINATLGLANIVDIYNILEECRLNGMYYNTELKDVKGIELLKECYPTNTPSYWIYTLKVLNGRKSEFMDYMKDRGIVVSQVHARNDNNTCLSQFKNELPNLDIMEKQIVCIPVGWWVTEENREYIVKCIKDFCNDGINIVIANILYLDEVTKDKYCKLFDTDVNRLHHIIHGKAAKAEIYCLKVGKNIVATGKLLIEQKLNDQMGHIEDVLTQPEYRGKGYGKMLVEHLIDIALNTHKCYKVVLACKHGLENFYNSCGMTVTGSSLTKYNPNLKK